MKLILNENSDILKLNLQDQTFEWTYFETEFLFQDEQYNLVIIFSNGLFLSPDFYSRNHKPNLNISLQNKDKNIFFSYQDYADITFENNKLKLGDSTITYLPEGVREISLSAKDFVGHEIKVEVTFYPKYIVQKAELSFASQSSDRIEWGLASLDYRCVGSLKMGDTYLEINSEHNYHDYNYGEAEYFYQNIKKWFWFRNKNQAFLQLDFLHDEPMVNVLLKEESDDIQVKINVPFDILKQKLNRMLVRYPQIFTLNSEKYKSDYDLDFKMQVARMLFPNAFYTRRHFCSYSSSQGSGTLEIFYPQRMKSKLLRFAFEQGVHKEKRNIFSKLILRP